MRIFEINFAELSNVFIRGLISLLILFFITKLLGKKQVSQMSLFDYVIGISIGNFAAEMTVNLETEEINGIFAVIIFGVIAYLVSYLTLKSIKLRRFFMGVPSIIIEQGKIIEKNMKKNKIDVNDLLEQCRTNGYFDISQIDYAILEVNGELSILPKTNYRPLNLIDMNIKKESEGLCANVIIDRKIMLNNLVKANKNKDWLMKQLKIKGYNNLENILLATLDNKNKLIVYEKNNDIKSINVLE